jgi:hypothetical protein
MKEYIKSQFSEGDVVRHKLTNEDGKIDKVSIDDEGRVTYTVHIPTDRFGWQMGSRAAEVPWDETDVSASPNEALKG